MSEEKKPYVTSKYWKGVESCVVSKGITTIRHKNGLVEKFDSEGKFLRKFK